MTITPMFLVSMEIIAIGAGFLIAFVIGKIDSKVRTSKEEKENKS